MMPLGAYIEGQRCISHGTQILRCRMTEKTFRFRFFAVAQNDRGCSEGQCRKMPGRTKKRREEQSRTDQISPSNLSGILTTRRRLNIAGLFQAYGGRIIFWTSLANLTAARHFNALRVREMTVIVFILFLKCLDQPSATRSLSENFASILARSTQPKWNR